MSIKVIKISDNLFTATATYPHAKMGSWSTIEPLDAKTIIKALVEQGCHPVDIWDAMPLSEVSVITLLFMFLSALMIASLVASLVGLANKASRVSLVFRSTMLVIAPW